jgi:hypothetical protein
LKEKWAIRSQAPLYQVCLEMIEVNVLPTLACSVINELLVALVGYSVSLLRWLRGEGPSTRWGPVAAISGIHIDVLLRLKV